MSEHEPCLLWNSTRRKAENRGFRMDQECPVASMCEGGNCLIINGPKATEKVVYDAGQHVQRTNTITSNN